MGVEAGMDRQGDKVILYTSQPDRIVHDLRTTGVHYAKSRYIALKYGEVADVFLEAYAWYTEHASVIVAKPKEAESAVWAFCDERYLERYAGFQILKLLVLMENIVFFRMRDWNKILNHRFLGIDEEAEVAFANKLLKNGVQYEGDIYTTPFFPHLKRELIASWKNLFLYDRRIKNGEILPYADIQVGCWCLRSEWILPRETIAEVV